jgi:hypothetical protein
VEYVKGVEDVEDVEGVELLRHQGKVILCRREPAVSRCQKGAANRQIEEFEEFKEFERVGSLGRQILCRRGP